MEGVRCGGRGAGTWDVREVAMDRYLIAGSSSAMYS